MAINIGGGTAPPCLRRSTLLAQLTRKLFIRYFLDLKWHTVFVSVLIYMGSCWLLLRLCGELEITSDTSFIYWLVVTASTVGYGDLSPVTNAGKWVVALYVIPLGLMLFGVAIGRVAAFVSHQWRKGVQGLKTLDEKNHILIIGWNGYKTLQLIKLLNREIAQWHEHTLVLCVRREMDNPLPEEIGFVRVSSFNNDDEMNRAGVKTASRIIIDNPEDDLTMTSALYCASRNPSAHIIAYFHEEELGALLNSHCPNIECMPSMSVEMIAKSTVDPGSSVLHHELLDANEGMTQYSAAYEGTVPVAVKQLFSQMKERYDATLIAVAGNERGTVLINPPLDRQILTGSTIYYIADERISSFDWREMTDSDYP